MKHWATKLRQSFRRTGKGPVAARKPMDVNMPAPALPPSPPPPPPQSTDDIYSGFRREVLPVLEALKNLPKDSEGKEFFLRADIVTRDMVEKPEDMRIDVWLFYTQESGPQPRLHEAPRSHLISMESKKSTPEKRDYSQLIALGGAPVLRLTVHPQAAEDAKRMSSYTYIESYEKPQAGRTYTIYSGDYGMVIDESERKTLHRIEEFTNIIHQWLDDHTPGHKYTLREAMNPKTEIDLLPPINIRKRNP